MNWGWPRRGQLWPFYGAMCVALLLVTYILAISLWLPGLTR
jgi:TRAP-type C4-dicarboxylate transport system permease large subunit